MMGLERKTIPCLLVLFACNCVCAREGKRMAICEGSQVENKSLVKAIMEAKDGDILCLGPGEYEGGFEISKSITIKGTNGADTTIIKGTNRGPVIRIEEDGLNVRLEGITLSGGVAESGGGIAIRGMGNVQIKNCVIRDNRAGYYGGGGLFAKAGFLEVENTLFEGNEGNQGGAVLLDGAMKAIFRGCTFKVNKGERGGALRIREGVIVRFEKCRFLDNHCDTSAEVLFADGSTTRSPEISFSDCDIIDGRFEFPQTGLQPKVKIEKSRVPLYFKGMKGLTDGGDNQYQEVEK